MSTPEFANYLAELDRFARGESTAEEEYRREIAKKLADLERQRAFAFRRIAIVRTVGEGVRNAADAEQAVSLGNAACMHEIGWTGATEAQRETMAQFAPVSVAIWQLAAPQPKGEADEKMPPAKPEDIDTAFAKFEAWYSANRQGTFWNLMDQEPLNLPLVEIV